MLKQRIITAAILIPVTIALLFFLPPALFCILTGLFTLAGAWEWTNLMGVKKVQGRLLYLVLAALVFVGAVFVPATWILIAAFIWWLMAAALIVMYPEASHWWSKGVILRGIMGLLVLVPCWVAINFIRIQSDGVFAILFLFVIIWGADSAAYFVGRKWGKNKLAPQVSPGKSREGLIGALIFTILLTILIMWISHTPLNFWAYGVALMLLTVVFSVEGDLFESMMKRIAGVKDSGTLLPGHGGILDRIDSLTAAAPIFALGSWVMWLVVG